MRSIYCTRAAAAALSLAVAAPVLAQQPNPVEAPTSSFTVFVRSVPIGSEQIAVTRDADGWLISSSGRLGAPLDIVSRRLQVRYTPDWKPIELTLDAAVKGLSQSLHTTISGTTATSEITAGGGAPQQKTDTIPADALLLPNPFFGPYEALAARLREVPAGTTLRAWAVPQVAFELRVGESETEQIQTATALITAKRTHVTTVTAVPLDMEVWSDGAGRLLRLSVPAQNLEVVREDIASVAARRVTVSRPNDEQFHVPGNGFSLAGTVSKPFDVPKQPMPAVVLVGGSGATDRDEVVFNIPVFGQLASALADAGFLVIRYDKRGVGQSGGRLESAGLADFAEDLRAVVKYAADRKDVNPKKIAVLGHSEGGAVALLAAGKDKQIDALVLVAAPGVTGSDLILDQQKHVLDRSSMSEADKQAKIELQKQINAAVIQGKGLENLNIAPAVRRQIDTPWFQSLLTFDPAKVVPGVRQPMLIVQGELDTQVTPSNADRLAGLARARKNAPPTDLVKIPGVNHLLVPATTGESDEYSTLKDKHISTDVAAAIVAWLQKTLR